MYSVPWQLVFCVYLSSFFSVPHSLASTFGLGRAPSALSNVRILLLLYNTLPKLQFSENFVLLLIFGHHFLPLLDNASNMYIRQSETHFPIVDKNYDRDTDIMPPYLHNKTFTYRLLSRTRPFILAIVSLLDYH